MSDGDNLGFQVIDKRIFATDDAGVVGSSVLGEASVSPNEPKNETVATQSSCNTHSCNCSGHDPSHQTKTCGQDVVDFSGFILGLMHQAVIMMGDTPHPETGQVIENLEVAHQTIEVLAILENKTKGNLLEEEERLLRDGLTGLRMAYVAKLKNKKK